jgi:hypothetical protein
MNNRKRDMTLDLFCEFDAARDEDGGLRAGVTRLVS